MAWVILVAAGLFETAFAVFLKLSHGLTNPWPTAGFAASALISFGLLTVALRELEVGPAYAVWTGIGVAGAATAGMMFLGATRAAADADDDPARGRHQSSRARPSRYPPPSTVCTIWGRAGSSSTLRRRFFTCESTVRS